MELPINLDDISPEELSATIAQISRERVKAKRRARQLGKLLEYAISKQSAVSLRLQGDIPGAQAYESLCESIYRDFPASLKW